MKCKSFINNDLHSLADSGIALFEALAIGGVCGTHPVGPCHHWTGGPRKPMAAGGARGLSSSEEPWVVLPWPCAARSQGRDQPVEPPDLHIGAEGSESRPSDARNLDSRPRLAAAFEHECQVSSGLGHEQGASVLFRAIDHVLQGALRFLQTLRRREHRGEDSEILGPSTRGRRRFELPKQLFAPPL